MSSHASRFLKWSLLFGLTLGVSATAETTLWRDPAQPADVRAEALVQAMTQDEKLQLVFGQFGSVQKRPAFYPAVEARMGSAGYVPGIARLGIPPQWITDAGLGVATQRQSAAPYRERTALPGSIAAAASFDPAMAYRGGAMIGAEARASGFNVMLGGGIDLLREPRGGRNFEYAGEDPLLAASVVGAAIAGIQSNGIISTIKHFAFNAQETGRMVASADIADSAARMSDLLAFELAIEKGKPGAAMCAYNRVNTVYACESDYLLTTVLKNDWRYRGYVMSDWGAVHSTEKAANAGLDQESAYTFDAKPFFGAPLRQAVIEGKVPQARLDDMARRIAYAMFATGLYDNPVAEAPIDFEASRKVAQAAAEGGIVLLKNAGVLPLTSSVKHIVVIGSHADKGVMSGGGSSTVFPQGVNAVPGIGPQGWPGPVVFLPSSPLAALKSALPGATVEYLDGADAKAAAAAAAKADLAIVFASQWSTEDADHDLNLPDGLDDLIAAVAAANAKTVVVLQNGGPVLMPWLDKAAGVVEAWFPGAGGGEAIARVLTGAVDASGRLPVTFPASLAQLAHPALPGTDANGKPFAIEYTEGAAVGYKWFAKNRSTPLFPFGFGLSYTHFSYGKPSVATKDGRLTVTFDVTNTGKRAGAAVPQIYVGPAAGADAAQWEAPFRLAGWGKAVLQPGETRAFSVSVDPRLLARFDSAARAWTVSGGTYTVSLGASAADFRQTASVHVDAALYAVDSFAKQ